MNILLIEDDDVIRKGLAIELEKAGHFVKATKTADLIETPGFNLQDYNCIITDCDTPPFNAVTVVRSVINEPRPIPCLIHSWNKAIHLNNIEIVLPDQAELYDWITYHERGVGRVKYIWNFIDEVERLLP